MQARRRNLQVNVSSQQQQHAEDQLTDVQSQADTSGSSSTVECLTRPQHAQGTIYKQHSAAKQAATSTAAAALSAQAQQLDLDVGFQPVLYRRGRRASASGALRACWLLSGQECCRAEVSGHCAGSSSASSATAFAQPDPLLPARRSLAESQVNLATPGCSSFQLALQRCSHACWCRARKMSAPSAWKGPGASYSCPAGTW